MSSHRRQHTTPFCPFKGVGYTALEPQSGGRYLAWGVSPKYQGQNNFEPRRGDRNAREQQHLSPLRGFSVFST